MVCLPGYRYCGPGCRGPGKPLNQLDALCRQHDSCYLRSGTHRNCDELFLNRLRPFIHRRDKLGRDAMLMYRAMLLKRRLGDISPRL
ncbi:Parvovirus coat protein VP1-like protein [Sediminibacillus massiliensis]|uniref:Parvovirus coat protein VP1-like protein n=1 Tax=Sediminibacillus massiliensis TaxID=1926277 RepID=UPI00098865FA|nr:Parvovirus coat protein VP1-like protein [Sediminibacillus massiliensis]